jgi:hypothetical protein
MKLRFLKGDLRANDVNDMSQLGYLNSNQIVDMQAFRALF